MDAPLSAARSDVMMLTKSLRRLGRVVWLWPAPVTRAECNAEFILGPTGKLLVKVLGGVGERGKHDGLAVAGIEGLSALLR